MALESFLIAGRQMIPPPMSSTIPAHVFMELRPRKEMAMTAEAAGPLGNPNQP
jgi:hypothetical protein